MVPGPLHPSPCRRQQARWISVLSNYTHLPWGKPGSPPPTGAGKEDKTPGQDPPCQPHFPLCCSKLLFHVGEGACSQMCLESQTTSSRCFHAPPPSWDVALRRTSQALGLPISLTLSGARRLFPPTCCLLGNGFTSHPATFLCHTLWKRFRVRICLPSFLTRKRRFGV